MPVSTEKDTGRRDFRTPKLGFYLGNAFCCGLRCEPGDDLQFNGQQSKSSIHVHQCKPTLALKRKLHCSLGALDELMKITLKVPVTVSGFILFTVLLYLSIQRQRFLIWSFPLSLPHKSRLIIYGLFGLFGCLNKIKSYCFILYLMRKTFSYFCKLGSIAACKIFRLSLLGWAQQGVRYCVLGPYLEHHL